MNTINVAMVNNVSLQVVAGDREQLVAIRPVCEILGVAYPPQFTKIKEHPIYGSVVTLSVTTGSDGKSYEMACLPLRYFPSWLFSINPNNVKEEIREKLVEYQMKCNDILFDYFFGRAEFAQKKEQEFSHQLEVVADAKRNFHEARTILNKAEIKLRKINELTFEDYANNNRQLTIPGFE